MATLSLDEDYLIVAAIDFGTTFSGYAFSFKSSPNNIHMNKNWGSELGCQSYKTPTCLMTSPGGLFHSFGYKAELDYSLLEQDKVTIGGPKGYNLYRHFKMMLHSQGVNIRSIVRSTTGHAVRAIDVFEMALRYLCDHMIEAIQISLKKADNSNKQNETSTSECLDSSDIRWVLTVPAIWSDEAKGFMREAAYRAGLIAEKNSKKLLFAHEPEAASIYCRSLDIGDFRSNMKQSRDAFKVKSGEKMLMIDAGGGTIDITAYEVLANGSIREICPPSGGPWGGTNVDDKFIFSLKNIFTFDFISYFQYKYSELWLNILTRFEIAKKAVVPDGETSIKVEVPFLLSEELTSLKKKSVKEMVEQSNENGVSFSKNGFIVMNHEKAREFFSEPVSKTVSHIQKLIHDTPMLKQLNYIFLVGGFAGSKLLQEECWKAFTGFGEVIVPVDAQMAIIKGALQFGYNPSYIESRVARYTYGTACSELFDDTKHDSWRKLTGKDGETRCDNIFSIFINKDEHTQTGSLKTQVYHPWYKSQPAVRFPIYKTDVENVMYVDEPEVTFLGEARLESPEGQLGEDIEVQITFGHTEILIEARDTSRGEDFPMKITVDFLSK